MLLAIAGALSGLVYAAMNLFVWNGYVWTNDANIDAFGSDLSSFVTENVAAIHFDEGDFVRKGDLIVQLDDNIPLAKKREAEAKIVSLEQEIKVKQAFLLKTLNDYIRAKEGIVDKVISPQEYDHKEKDYEMAQAELELAFANLDLAKRELGVIEAELSHYFVKAPYDGTLAKRWIWLGDVTSPGQSMFTMYNLKDVWVLANLEEKKMENVRLGALVRIHIDAYPGFTFEGEIFTIKEAAASQFTLVPQNNATGNFTKVAQRIPIKISIRPPEDFPKDKPLYLFPGMSAEVWIKVE